MPDINLVIVNEHFDTRLAEVLFSGEGFSHLRPGRVADGFTFLDVLLASGVFSSKSQARKAGHEATFQPGWTDLVIGKKKTRICIWVPVPC